MTGSSDPRLAIGTSGWQYADWKHRLYQDVPQKRWLEHYAEAFGTVELNNAFYRLPPRETFEGWHARTPDDFVVAVKASRYLTHIKRLREPAEPAARLMAAATGLGDKLGPILLQLPPTLRADVGLLTAALDAFPAGVRLVVEPRHPSWWTSAVEDVLAERRATLCWADRASRPITPLWRTADVGYLRLHHGAAKPWPRYGRQALRSWLDRLAAAGTPEWFVYFNNDPGGAAVIDAMAFAKLARAAGLTVTRTPHRVGN